MPTLSQSMPIWFSVSLFLSIFIGVFDMTRIVFRQLQKSVTDPGKRQHLKNQILLFLILFFMIVAGMSLMGLFVKNVLPPRILILTTLPLLAFYFIYLFKQQLLWKMIDEMPLSEMIRMHRFRFLGIFFILGWYLDLLPAYFAFAAGLGDLITAISSIPIARLKHRESPLALRIALIWNLFGFWEIIHLMGAAIWVISASLKTGENPLGEMGMIPLCFLPAFAPPTILFLHICIFKKWRKLLPQTLKKST